MFTREETKMFKGLAVILMLAHHVLLFPERMPIGYEIISMGSICGIEIERIIGSFGKICVSYFMFLGGYGMWCQAQDSKNGSVSIGKHIIQLYQSLWEVMLIFIPVGFLIFGNQPVYAMQESLCVRFSNFEWKTFLMNFTGWNTTYNGEWWFFYTYLCTLFLGCVFIRFIWKHDNKYVDIALVMFWEILSSKIFPELAGIECFSNLNNDIFFKSFLTISDFTTVFFMGIVIAKYDALNILSNLFKMYSSLLQYVYAFMIQILVIYMRVFFDSSAGMDIIYIPMLISSGRILCNKMIGVKRILQFVGKYSTYMWLIHSFFCYYFYPIVKIVYYTRNGLISLLILLGLTLGASILLDIFWKGLRTLFFIEEDKKRE